MSKVFLFSLFSILLFSCSENKPKEVNDFSDCKYSIPTPVFSTSNKAIETTAFEVVDRKGIENVIFKNKLKLELVQSGCNEVKQDFTFIVPMVNKSADQQFWLYQAEQLLRFLGNSDMSLVQFGEWSNVIKELIPEMYLGQEKEIQTGYFVTIDKIDGGEETIIKIVLEGK